MKNWAIGIDIGGTFTDVVALNYNDGKLHSLKVLTTHVDPAVAVIDGVSRLMKEFSIEPALVGRVVHATTLFTNALIERRGACTGLVVTQGFKDVIEIGNERKYDLYDLQIEAAPALVPRNFRVEIAGRLDAGGQELSPLDLEQVRTTVSELVAQGIESVGVCLMHSYASDQHEKAVGALIAREFPQLEVTLSSETAPVIREFERISTTVANAYIRPLATRYLDTLASRLQALGFPSGVLMMLSNGGLSHIDEAKRSPIELLESGPAAGAISAVHYSLRNQHENLLAFDMGGTTAKLCLVEAGKPAMAYGFEAARQKRFAEGSGLPIRITTIDLIEIGAGGGSIAHQDQMGLLKVGPRSAGSEPGPVCYGRGGVEPTVTDANLVLGYLNPNYFAGGTVSIRSDLAVAALEKLGTSLDRDAAEAAWGIHDVVAENMAGAARVHVAERGRDPHDFILLCTGGGGPVHSYYVAQKIGVKTILCPPAAGVASAYGLLVASARADRSRTVLIRPSVDSLDELEVAYQQLEKQARLALSDLAATFGPVSVVRHADGRFAGQGFNFSARFPQGPYNADAAQQEVREELVEALESAYREKFGRTPPDVPLEIVTLRVTAEGPPKQSFEAALPETTGTVHPKEKREVYFREVGRYVSTPIYERASLPVGFKAMGPMVVEDPSSSLVVGPKGQVEHLASGNLVIRIKE